MKYRVHNFSTGSVDVAVKDEEGHEFRAPAPACLIELVPVLDYGKSFTIMERYKTEKELKALVDTFPVGGIVEHGPWVLVKQP